MKKLLLLAVAGAGYVLGAKAGRQRYEQIKSGFVKVKDNPTVQQKAHQVADVAKEQAPVVKDKIVEAAGVAAAKVKPGGGSDDLADQLNPDSTVHQGDKAYPQGDLP
ncbi:hypothetical protein [Nocardioides bigeumensis]|uniref:YtxH domain-containing protein n=1 Tax=Nocardioides bigeumensis TaxID=433657 RepID=A0ABP5JUW9_9ACTN